MSIPLLTAICLLVAGQTAPRQDSDDASDNDLKPVKVFQRKAIFVAQDLQLRFLDVATPGEPKPVFRLHWLGDLNVQIALAKDPHKVIVTDGKVIYQVSDKGEVETLASLAELRKDGAERKGVRGFISGFFATSSSRSSLFFVLDGAIPSIGRINLETKKLDVIDCPFGMNDIDGEADIVYWTDAIAGRVGAQSTDRSIDKKIATSKPYFLCRLSPEKKRLLLSNHDLQPPSQISLIDLATDQEKILPITGSHAVWGVDHTVFFVRGSNSLWRYRVGDPTPVEVFTVPGKPIPGYAIAPQLSSDKTWLAWQWTVKTNDGFRNGTILIDLKNNEYRQLNGWWYNVQWLDRVDSADNE